MWISLIADGVIAILLGVTIFYCTLVNRRLAALRSGKDELKQVIDDLTVATTSAHMNIERLKEAGKEVVFTLEDDVRKGRALSDELALMIESGNNLADRLEGSRGQPASGATAQAVSEENGMVKKSQPRREAGSDVRARVQVQSEVNRAQSGAAPKSAGKDGVIENELLKALRRAR